MASPTQRTLDHFRRLERPVWIVERWIPRARKRIDLFHMFDLVALDGEQGILGLQPTSRGNVSARKNKILDCEYLEPWFEAGNRVEVWGWGKVKRKGREVYRPRVLRIHPGGEVEDRSAEFDLPS